MSKILAVTGVVRIAYVNIFEPSLNVSNGKSQYSLLMLIDKTDALTINTINDACNACKIEKFGAQIPPGLKMPLRDGDVQRPDSEMFQGKYFMNISSKFRPGIFASNGLALDNPTSIESGDYCRIRLNMFGYSAQGNNGISAGLTSVMLIQKGEPLVQAPDASVFNDGYVVPQQYAVAPEMPAMPVNPAAPAYPTQAPQAPYVPPVAPQAPYVAPVAPVAPQAPYVPPVAPVAPQAPYVPPVAPQAPYVPPVAPVAPVAPQAPYAPGVGDLPF